MPGPTLFIKNALRLSELGLGDGTVYASATGATPNATQKTFALAGLSIIGDIGADADDKFNGGLLYFPASKNSYHIVDWVAGTDTATTYENPALTDVGACEVRRSLVCKLALAGNPAKFLADGQRYALWKSAANTTIEVHLPNLLDNGGFESAALSPWTKSQVGGTADTTGVNAAAPILGSRDLKINKNDRTSVTVSQGLRTMKKNRAYRLLFKAKFTGVFTANQFEAKLTRSGADVILSAPSSGTIAGQAFLPTLTAAAGWHSVDITAPDWDVVAATLQLNLTGVFDVLIDEIYLFEKVDVAALLLFDHGGLVSLTEVRGRYVSKDRSLQVAGIDNVQLTGAATITQGEAALAEFAAGIYPIYTIESADMIEAGEILLAEKWTWQFGPELPDERDRVDYDEKRISSRSGVTQRYLYSKRRHFPGQLVLIDPIDVPIWKGAFKDHHLDPAHPFAARYESFWGNRPALWRSASTGFSLNYRTPNYPDMKIEWEEVVK